MGATKTEGDGVVRWISNGEPVDPEHPAWKTDPRKDEGQFYAKSENVSCLLINLYKSKNGGGSSYGWGIKDGRLDTTDSPPPLAKTLCERQIG